ncbi:MAG: alkaline phosphatase family protein [Desulfovibrionaceae bacterium]
MSKLIFVLLDGCNAATAQECMGYLSALVAAGKAHYTTQYCELPALSRPLYHCILTGILPNQSGIVHNTVWQPHPAPTFFHAAHQAGLVTAAAAYHWINELCNGIPTDTHARLTVNPTLPLSYGLFYNNDAYPDDHVFLDAEALRLHYAPHLSLVHSMGIDYAGHCFGADSAEYRNAVRAADMLLAQYLPLWLQADYQVVITSDHGMNADKSHNGVSKEERQVPVWTITHTPSQSVPSHQYEWFSWCCTALGI